MSVKAPTGLAYKASGRRAAALPELPRLRSGYAGRGEALGSGRIAWEGDAMASSANSQPAGSIKLQQRTTKTVEQGSPFPLGATPVGDGVNFAIYSKHAAEVFLLLFDTPDGEPTDVIRSEEHTSELQSPRYPVCR